MHTTVALARTHTSFVDPSFAGPLLMAVAALPQDDALEQEASGTARLHLYELSGQGQLAEPQRGADAIAVQEVPHWKIRQHRLFKRFAVYLPASCRLSFSPDGRYLAAAIAASRLLLWDTLLCRTLPILEIAGLSDYVFVQGSEGGKPVLRLLLVGAAGLTVATFRAPTQEESNEGGTGAWQVTIKLSAEPLTHIALHAALGLIAILVADRREVPIWALSDIFSPQGTRLSLHLGSADGPLRLLPKATKSPPETVAFLPEGMVVTSHARGELAYRHALISGKSLVLGGMPARALGGYSPVVSADGRRLALWGEQEVLLCEREALWRPFHLLHYVMPPRSQGEGGVLAFTYEHELVALSDCGDLFLCSWPQGKWQELLQIAGAEIAKEGRKGQW